MAKVKVTRNYQVTIPEEVRRELDIKEGDYVKIECFNKTSALIKKLIPVERLEGSWDEEMDEIMEEVRGLWRAWKL
ncbi:MAG: AbrB/MazE/SpoVT family DNA-binding domain-containing protein [Candidatus Bathyarchaeia archaeon]